MASNKARIQPKHIAAIIAVVSVLLFMASIALLTIGFLNAYSSIGMGILGAGAVLFFTTEVFLCMGYIWLRNKINENNSKLASRSIDDIALLKPASNMTSTEKKRDTTNGDDHHVSLHYETTGHISPSAAPEKILSDYVMDSKAGWSQAKVFTAHPSNTKNPSNQKLETFFSPHHTGGKVASYGKLVDGGGNTRKLLLSDDKITPLVNKPNVVNIEKIEKPFTESVAIHGGLRNNDIRTPRNPVTKPQSVDTAASGISKEKKLNEKINLQKVPLTTGTGRENIPGAPVAKQQHHQMTLRPVPAHVGALSSTEKMTTSPSSGLLYQEYSYNEGKTVIRAQRPEQLIDSSTKNNEIPKKSKSTIPECSI
ncbi:Hypothetical predicted protein [Pelobates cultripes]|uniref:Uncharacterized protein n=1 Tax=Pelobates cultripes TaxID=61616 RepID=A0AAD1S8S1_PELCU|nr:Hypothetical predicted protein [Pelobates cultripes]